MSVAIDVINRSSVMSDTQAAAITHALQTQVDRDFGPVWSIEAKLTFRGAGAKPDPHNWWLVFLDNSDDATALGYHEMTSAGLPIGKAFIKTTMVDGGIPSVCASHELLEMLADPYIDRTVMYQETNQAGRIYALEVCDACEDDVFGYDINGVTVSDFVHPTWFQGWRGQHSSAQFDYGKHIKEPFQLLSGGYISMMDFRGGGWQQITADTHHMAQFRAHVGQRRERRRLPRNLWRPSDPK
jgi:hypothetical protein